MEKDVLAPKEISLSSFAMDSINSDPQEATPGDSNDAQPNTEGAGEDMATHKIRCIYGNDVQNNWNVGLEKT